MTRRALLGLVAAGLLPTLASAQEARQGFFFGAAAGAATIQSATASGSFDWRATASFPNFKLGTMLSDRLGLALYLPGTLYRWEGGGRARDRGFEGAMLSVQGWVSERWWLLAGAGLGLDAPAFYDVRTPEEGKYYLGIGAALGAGYEIWQRGGFALDLQARVQAERVSAPDGARRGWLALDLLVGANWY